MKPAGIIDEMIESKLLGMNTAFIAKIDKMQGEDMCSVQPLSRIKALGNEAQNQAIVTNVPILNHVRHYSLEKQNISVTVTAIDSLNKQCTVTTVVSPNPHPSENNVGHLKVEPLKAGDIVFCVCADRDIAETKDGNFATPPQGHHSINDAVVVGLLGGW